MAGYQTIEALRPILSYGPALAPPVDVALVMQRPGSRKQNEPPDRFTRAEIVRLRSENVPIREVARRLCLGKTTVLKYSRHVAPPAGGWSTGGHTCKLNRPFAERLRRSEFTYKEIAENLGCVESAVYQMLNGRVSRPRGERRRVHRLVEKVSRATVIPTCHLRKGRRPKDAASPPHAPKARQILFWLCRRDLQNVSLSQIAVSLGGYHHTTVLHACRRVSAVCEALELNADEDAGTIAKQLWARPWPKALG